MGWTRNWNEPRTKAGRGPKRSVPFAFEHGIGCPFCEQAQGRDRSSTKKRKKHSFRCDLCKRTMTPVMMQLTHHEQKQGWIGFRRWVILGYTLEIITLTEFMRNRDGAL